MDSICDRDCFNCKFEDCIEDSASVDELMEIEKRGFLQKMESTSFPQGTSNRRRRVKGRKEWL